MPTENETTHELIRKHLVTRCHRSTTPIVQWRHTLDAQQAFLELWWLDDETALIERFGMFNDVQGQSAQFFKILNRISGPLLDREVSAREMDRHNQALNDARTTIEGRIEEVLFHISKPDSGFETVTLAQIVKEAIADRVLPNDDRSREMLVSFWLNCNQFYRPYLMFAEDWESLPENQVLRESPVWKNDQAASPFDGIGSASPSEPRQVVAELGVSDKRTQEPSIRALEGREKELLDYFVGKHPDGATKSEAETSLNISKDAFHSARRGLADAFGFQAITYNSSVTKYYIAPEVLTRSD